MIAVANGSIVFSFAPEPPGRRTGLLLGFPDQQLQQPRVDLVGVGVRLGPLLFRDLLVLAPLLVERGPLPRDLGRVESFALLTIGLEAVGAQIFFSAFYLDLVASGAARPAVSARPRDRVERETDDDGRGTPPPPAAPGGAPPDGAGLGTAAP